MEYEKVAIEKMAGTVFLIGSHRLIEWYRPFF